MSEFTKRLRNYNVTMSEDVIIHKRDVVDEAANIIDELENIITWLCKDHYERTVIQGNSTDVAEREVFKFAHDTLTKLRNL